jgi:uncharacterized membrane-anchored protein
MKTMGHARGKPLFDASQPGLKTGCSRSRIMFSQTLGIALGDWTTDSAGSGYEGGAIVFGSMLAVIAILYYRTRISHTLLFRAVFILPARWEP